MPQEIALAACLILVSMESILGDTTSWSDHLSGAASIIQTTLTQRLDKRLASSLESSLEGRWLLRNFAYHDILASVTLNREMLIPDLYWFRGGENIVDTYFGLASIPMAMLAEITTLPGKFNRLAGNATAVDVAVPTCDYTSTSLQVSRIEQQLLDWHPGEARDASLMSLAESYRSAALIQLYRTLRYHYQDTTENLNHKITCQVNNVFAQVEKMPAACLPECTLLFPLFLAGGETNDLAQQQLVRKRMQDIATYRRFENVSVALMVAEEVWDVQSRALPIDAWRPYDWLSVLERRGWKLALS
ncbi:hypothetical protein LTR08_003740 [Meristemomyces frigidus]|nr:hypothetical protein LTR08_003740 [Meristemomyces frigidus]